MMRLEPRARRRHTRRAADGATMKRMRYEARTAAGALNSHAAMCLVS